MSFLPDVVDGVLQETEPEPALYTPPHHRIDRKKLRTPDEKRLAELNNLEREEVPEDFSDQVPDL
jgi:hypothetical protein